MNITIPPAALEAGMNCMPIMSEDEARSAFLAMMGAWPGMIHGKYFAEPSIILPLPQEASDDQ